MSYQIFTLEKKGDWVKKLKSFDLFFQDINFHPNYYEVFEKQGEGKSMCFVFEQDNKIILYPFLQNSVKNLGYQCDRSYFDITGPHGYNGAIANSEDAAFISAFNESFIQYCNDTNIIAEFVRFHPVFSNEIYFTRTQNSVINKNIVVDLEVPDLLASFEYSVRKNIKKATRCGLVVRMFTGDEISTKILEMFYHIYQSTLSRNSADESSLFEFTFFKTLVNSIKNNASIFFTFSDDVPISTELLLWGKTIGYSYLGGTLGEYFEFRPNEILKYEAMQFLKKSGRRYFLLGGGKQMDDGIFNYKANYARTGILDFLIGKKIYNESVYYDLIQQWEAKSSPEKVQRYRNYFYRYRL